MSSSFERAFDLSGQVALITGGASGIGLAVAELFADRGARLVLLDLSESVLALAQQLPGQHLAVVCNVADTTQLKSAVGRALERFARIDILVNNAGVGLLDRADAVQEADWDKTMAINLKAPFFLAQAVAPVMAGQGGGRIVNLASQASVIALERHAAYCASKAALVSLTQVLALEWAPLGITVNAVSPTVVETELGKRAWAGEVGEAMKKKIPTGRFAQPAEIAAAILYLVSGHAGMITGENLVIDGGYTIQ
ncbi:SDR family oxidoreductase [Verminephrobacter aporrectodeae]|uniref:D-threitol dehydrogenase n=1 Tax=Verminephrobacter aporrectodeae subsp. tuberculatae TaxID=1110392 RepID=A0ABT3KXP1_9BURK|nr:D-threitol dehydrogenase [Verminephrobacter aporrectodeae]MCW5221772.1 D-threitol dehydrogenase [Verminephrobacter aporrectodeae subsp. tuberculatae]MCW5258082.1 D-threitol dehydrogenase [Verminephrobacter aporrectodeae subsp. tuberculatae]MCW5291062.1 D-threitol dehydrogenase [Verminephrobacter aporrectodeae subsp. tuberculatae]MCW5322777.1 D-threitol dehydrogenase [Verminephrobacter aporrectodeae subsp. tuberculatae]MCW8175789.1 D-threitol dehydrogenase [Verminephrobacter aporrectodeae su